jgi:PDDEXK-like domain of unknown function (DUF3799)
MIDRNVSFATYAAAPGLNQSKLGAFKKCPAKFKWLLENERGDTDSLRLGRAIHTATLEPNKFNQEFFCLPEIDRRTTKGKETYAELVGKNPGKTILKPDEFHTALEVAQSIRSQSHCLTLLESAHIELTLNWQDKATGVLCKARVDAYDENTGVVVDIKTTQDASRSGFPKKLFAYGYHRQAAWYLEGLKANGEPASHFVFIAVEKEPPYCVGVYRLSDETIRLSKLENEALLRRYAECVRTDSWPGYTDGIEDISIPDYAQHTLEETYGEPI